MASSSEDTSETGLMSGTQHFSAWHSTAAARKETMKLAGLRLRVIWTLPVFYYLNLGNIEIKNCARVRLFSYLNLGKIERKN